jgi:hypothetical protein
MTPTIRRRIAREWLTFLAAVTLGFVVTYGVFYLGRSTSFDYRLRVGEAVSPEHRRWLVQAEVENDMYGQFVHRWFSKPKNPGDFFNDLWPIMRTYYRPRRYIWNEQAVKLWLCVLSPYFILLFVRSIIWSVNTLRRP